MSDSEQPQRAKRTARFVEDCNLAREQGLYQFLRHLTQGFQWDGNEWCRTCLQDAWAWWKIAQMTDQHDPELFQRILDESRPEVDQFLDHSRAIRERNSARRTATTAHPTPKVALHDQNDPKTVTVERRRSEQERQEKNNGENKQKPIQEEPSFLETSSKILSGLARWVATGKTQ